MAKNRKQVDPRSPATTTSTIPEEEDELQLRRRRINQAFMAAYGKDIKNIDQKRLNDLQRRKDGTSEEPEAQPQSPYNLQTAIWILGSIGILYYTDLIPAMKQDPRVFRTWLYIGITFIGLHVSIGAYLIVFLSWIKKQNDWEKVSPMAIPLATATYLIGALCLNIAMWPVYGILTPIMLFTLFMGFIVIVSLVPNRV